MIDPQLKDATCVPLAQLYQYSICKLVRTAPSVGEVLKCGRGFGKDRRTDLLELWVGGVPDW